MQLDALLEVAIGLIFVWLILSVTTSELKELIGRWLGLRSKFLAQTVIDMFKHDMQLVDQFYNHPGIVEISKKDKDGNVIKPDHIPNEVFSEVAMEILLNAGKKGQEAPAGAMSFDVMQTSKAEAKQNVNPDVARLVDRLFPEPAYAASGGMSYGIGEFEDKISEYRGNVERWFDNVMTQSSDWYKKNAQIWAFWIGLALALAFNIDTINIANQLWRDPTVRATLVANAEAANDAMTNDFAALAFPVGWTTVPAESSSACNTRFTADGKITTSVGSECHVYANIPAYNDIRGWFTKLLGLLISAFAARQGAPFWFDVLKKVVNTRDTLKGKSEEKAKG